MDGEASNGTDPTEGPDCPDGAAGVSDVEIVVLIVDDEPEIRALARVVLEVSGHPVRVVEAGDGPAALAAAQAERPDLAVVDQMMPGQDGLTVAAALTTLHPGLPIALCSAAMDARLANKADELGIRWLLQKHELVSLPDLLDELAEG